MVKKVPFYRSTNKGLNKMTFKNDFDKIAHILGKNLGIYISKMSKKFY